MFIVQATGPSATIRMKFCENKNLKTFYFKLDNVALFGNELHGDRLKVETELISANNTLSRRQRDW